MRNSKGRLRFVRGSLYDLSGTLPGKSGSSGPRVGNFCKRSFPGVEGGASTKNYSGKELRGDTMASNLVDKSVYFLGKSTEFARKGQ